MDEDYGGACETAVLAVAHMAAIWEEERFGVIWKRDEWGWD